MLPETRGHRLAPNLLKKFSQGPLTAMERMIFLTVVKEDRDRKFFLRLAFPVGLDDIMSIYDIGKDTLPSIVCST